MSVYILCHNHNTCPLCRQANMEPRVPDLWGDHRKVGEAYQPRGTEKGDD